MTADDQDGFGFGGQRGGQALKEALCGHPGIGRAPRPIHEEAWAATVRDEDCGLAPGVGRHRLILLAFLPDNLSTQVVVTTTI
jgi:hypothetical protein